MALSKAAKAALIAGGLYGLYKMLGKSQDGKDVPVEDRSAIRKTIAEADKKEPVSSGRGKAAGAPAPSVKAKPEIMPYMDPSTVKPMPIKPAPTGPSDADIQRANLMQTAGLADKATPARRASMAARRDGTRAMRDAAVKERARAARAANIMPYMDPSTVVTQRPRSSGRGAMAGATAADFAGARAAQQAAEQARGEGILARETRRLELEDRARRGQTSGMKKGGMVKKSRDGMATKGKTKGRMC